MKLLCLFGTLIASVTCIVTARDPIHEDFAEIQAIVHAAIQNSTCVNDVNHWDWNETLQDCNLFILARGSNPLARRLVRHAFHDSMGVVDGFINPDETEHNGLQASTVMLVDMYSRHTLSSGESIRSILSFADFSAWAYVAALYFTFLDRGLDTPDIPIHVGRVTFEGDSPVLPHEDVPPFSGHSSGQQVADYFNGKFQFDEVDTAIAMGAHTLGGGQRRTSGFRGAWTGTRARFNNDYYQNLLNPEPLDCTGGPCRLMDESLCDGTERGLRCQGWELTPVRQGRGIPDKFQWQHSCDSFGAGCTQLMLHADMGLLRNIDSFINADTGEIIGVPAGCDIVDPVSGRSRIYASCFDIRTDLDSAALIVKYADDTEEQNFAHEFGRVFNIMINNVPPEVTLSELAAPTPAPTASQAPSSSPTQEPIRNRGLCPEECPRPSESDRTWPCLRCRSGFCGQRRRQAVAICRGRGRG